MLFIVGSMRVEYGGMTRVMGERKKGGGEVIGMLSSASDVKGSGSRFEPEIAFSCGRFGCGDDTLSP